MTTEPVADRGLELTASDKFTFSAETGGTQGDTPRPGATGEGQAASPAPGKRAFSDVERSPEASDVQAKRCNAAYQRVYQIPPEQRHSGLTGVFSGVRLDDPGPSPGGSPAPVRQQGPAVSSPLGVTKNLYCELHDPAEEEEEVFLAPEPEESSFTSDNELCRNLCMDSDGSLSESSVLVGESPTSEAAASSPRRATPSPDGERTGGRQVSLEPTPQRPALGSNLFRRGELQSPFLGRAAAAAAFGTQSPCFLKPRTGVAFRSYCSSIHRSNFSSHSAEAMDTSSMASFATGAVTPVQRMHSSSGSRYQVGLMMMMMMMCNVNHSGTCYK